MKGTWRLKCIGGAPDLGEAVLREDSGELASFGGGQWRERLGLLVKPEPWQIRGLTITAAARKFSSCVGKRCSGR